MPGHAAVSVAGRCAVVGFAPPARGVGGDQVSAEVHASTARRRLRQLDLTAFLPRTADTTRVSRSSSRLSSVRGAQHDSGTPEVQCAGTTHVRPTI